MQSHGLIGALRDVSIDVYDREIFVIMFDGKNLMTVSEKELIDIRRHKMGMVFQNFALLPHLTVLQNVAFPLEIQGLDRKSREIRALEMIELVGLKGRESYYPRELSGGQQQRVGIARSLAVEPELCKRWPSST